MSNFGQILYSVLCCSVIVLQCRSTVLRHCCNTGRSRPDPPLLLSDIAQLELMKMLLVLVVCLFIQQIFYKFFCSEIIISKNCSAVAPSPISYLEKCFGQNFFQQFQIKNNYCTFPIIVFRGEKHPKFFNKRAT